MSYVPRRLRRDAASADRAADRQGGRVLQHVAYLTSEYPAVSHTFVQRELLAVRDAGIRVSTFSIRMPAAGGPQSKRDAREQADTVYVLPPRWGSMLAAHAATLLTRPLRYARALWLALTVRPPGVKALLWQIFYFVEAVFLWRAMQRRGIGHVHVHFAMGVATTAMLAAELGDLTYSIMVHGPTVFYDVSRHMLREKARRACQLMCISQFCRGQVLSHIDPADADKLRIVHCGVNPEDYAPPKRSPDADGALRLLNVGRLSPVKAHGVLLEALVRLKAAGRSVRCTIVGDGPRRAALEQLAADLDVTDRVCFTGAVNQDEIQRYYDEADVFVLPSFAEGVPVVLMEAMAKEMPVVTCRIMGIPELVEDGVHGCLVTPGAVDELVAAIDALAGDADARRAMGRRGREKVQAEFDIRAIGAQLADLFREISEGAARP